MTPHIIPAILPRDYAEVVDKAEAVKGQVRTVQIDVCDGQFTPEPTWPYRKRDDAFERLRHEEEGLPCWEDLDYEIDLMTNKPEEVVEDWVSAGAARIIIHVESVGDVAAAVTTLGGRVEIGLALAHDTPLGAISPYRKEISVVQLMGIDNIGYQHQPFDAQVIARVREVREMYPDLAISVDGGVSLETAPALIAAGADRLVVGSAIYAAGNPYEAVMNFASLFR